MEMAMNPVIDMVAATGAFLLFHLIPNTPIRATAIRVMGRTGYLVLFSLISLALMALWAAAFAALRISPGLPMFWSMTPATRLAQIGIQLLAFQLMVAGSLTPNPANLRQEGALDQPVRGMIRITRHPFLWGMAIWASGHLLVNGEESGVIFFSAMLALALYGTLSIDARRRREYGERWRAFEAKTSSIPFAAILQGRQSLQIGEIGFWRIAASIALWAAAATAHQYVIGVRVWPW
jgi:uncharacterized membrane protein